jgi:hypothetical protein
LEGDRTTIRVTDDMGTLDAQLFQQGSCVGGLLGHPAWSGMPAAAGEPAPVVMDEPVVIGEGRLRQEWGQGICEVGPVDEQHRLACTPEFVLELPALHGNAIRHVILHTLVPRLRANAACEDGGSGRMRRVRHRGAGDHGRLRRRMQHCLR